jgi:alkanesulfonate monooxygenase SsuD/methylene tetrahydromethanopterin reductase-like flavin-dependent oxidoreductase (luciferase family)
MYFGLDVPTIGAYADPRILADLATEAEKAGWDGFFIWDVIFGDNQPTAPVVDPWVALAAIALATQRIKIGAFLTPLSRRRPWQLARTTVTLDHLSGGRLIFGAGLGYQALDFVPFHENFDLKTRAERLEEGLTIITGLWSGQPFTFHGQHYHLETVQFRPTPIQQPRIPIWLAGGWPKRKPLRRAAQWDGVYLMTVNQVTGELLTPEEIHEIATYIQAQRVNTSPFDIAVNGETPPDFVQGAAITQPYKDAGATWWVELSRDTPEQYRERIQKGPPKTPPHATLVSEASLEE